MYKMRLTLCLLALCSAPTIASEPTTAPTAPTLPQVEGTPGIAQAEKILVLTGDEKSVVIPLIKRVIDVRTTVSNENQKSRRALLAFLTKKPYLSDGDKVEVTKTLADYRGERNDREAELRKTIEALRAVLTVDNEAKLVALGVLDPPTPRN